MDKNDNDLMTYNDLHDHHRLKLDIKNRNNRNLTNSGKLNKSLLNKIELSQKLSKKLKTRVD